MKSLPLDDEVQRVIQLARTAADNEPCPFIDTDHLLLGLIRDPRASISRHLPGAVIDGPKVDRVFTSLLPERTHPKTTAQKYSVEFLQVMNNAEDIAHNRQALAVTAADVLAGLLAVAKRNRALLLLIGLGVDLDTVRQSVQRYFSSLANLSQAANYLDAKAYWKKYREIAQQWRQQKIRQCYNCALPSFRTITSLQEYLNTMSPYRRFHWEMLLNSGIEAYLAWRKQLQDPHSAAPPELKNTTL